MTHFRFVPHRGGACCYHCGDSYRFLPCSPTMMGLILGQYEVEHRNCAETPEGKTLLETVISEHQALPEDQKSTLGSLAPKRMKTLGDRVAHHLETSMLARCLDGDIPSDLAQDAKFMESIKGLQTAGITIKKE